MIRVYLAGPIGKPEGRHQRVLDALKVASEISEIPNVAVFIPHLCFYWDIANPSAARDYEWWMAYDQVWLNACQYLYRMQGDSPGADREVAHAKMMAIPVAYSIAELHKMIEEDNKLAAEFFGDPA